jgi:preprotein translocase SecE subunit
MTYKQDQGRMVRMVAFWSLLILLLYGCSSLRSELAISFSGVLAKPIGGIRVPILRADLSPAFLIAFVTFVGGLVLLRRWLEAPKNADLMIETEAELRKVTWPTLNEAIDGSVVVIVCVLVLMVFLAGSDWLLGRWAIFFFTTGS